MITSLNTLSLRVSYAAVAFLSASKALAQGDGADIFGTVPDIGGIDATDEGAIRQSILDVLGTILNFMALIAVIFIVIAGIRLVVSQGEEQEKDKAKKTIFYVVIGLIVILIAQAIVSFIAVVIAENAGA